MVFGVMEHCFRSNKHHMCTSRVFKREGILAMPFTLSASYSCPHANFSFLVDCETSYYAFKVTRKRANCVLDSSMIGIGLSNCKLILNSLARWYEAFVVLHVLESFGSHFLQDGHKAWLYLLTLGTVLRETWEVRSRDM